ncbi:MAG: response regulator [bacterium]
MRTELDKAGATAEAANQAVTAKSPPHQSTDFDLVEIAESAVGMCAVEARSKGLELLCFVDPSLPTEVNGDPTRLRRVLIKLLRNAIKFTEQGHVALEVIASKPGERREMEDHVGLHLKVSDTSVGISLQRLHEICNDFPQADSSTSRESSAPGRGLNLSSSAVEQLEGEFWVESKVGKGSVFHFKLRLGRAISQPRRRRITAGGSSKILVLAAKSPFRSMVCKTLAVYGFEVVGARDAAEVLRTLKSTPAAFDLLIAEEQLSRTESIDLLAEFEANPELHGIRMILLTTCTGDPDALRSAPGVAAILPKPVMQSALFRTVAELAAPAPEASEPPSVVLVEEEEEESPHPNKILLVEDTRANQILAARILQKAGYVVDTAENGMAAVAAVKENVYDLIIMDIQMPEMDGFTATQKIRMWEEQTARARVPIIAFTAHAIQGYRQKCLGQGMDDYITKPVRKQALLDMVAKWIGSRPILVTDDGPDTTRLVRCAS